MQEKAYFHLLRKMLAGELPAGTPLSEPTLAKQLGISRTPLREAIRRLAAEGFLRQIPNRGAMVVEFSKREIGELYELREALEVYAVGKAAEHAVRPSDLEQLKRTLTDVMGLREELLALGAQGLSGEQMQRFVQIDLSFHSILLRAAGNRRILKAITDTRVLLNVFAMRRKGHNAAQLADIHGYHSDVLDAVIRRDPATAMRFMGEHIRVSQRERLCEFEEWEHEMVLKETGAGLAAVVNWNQLATTIEPEP